MAQQWLEWAYSMYLPDFTIHWQGTDYIWEHVDRLDLPEYKNHWETKQQWYEKNFPGQLIATFEGPDSNRTDKKNFKG